MSELEGMPSLYGQRHPEALRKEGQLAVGFLLLVLGLILPYLFGMLTGLLNLGMGKFAFAFIDVLFCLVGVVGMCLAALSMQGIFPKIILILAGMLWLFVQIIVTVMTLI